MSDRFEPVYRLVESQRVRWRRLQLLQAAGLAVSVVLAYFLLAVLLDNFARLPVALRWLSAAGLIGSCVWCVRLLIRRWGERSATADRIALAMEQQTAGGVQNRLINVLQISRDSRTPDAMATHRPGKDGAASEAQRQWADALVQENCRHLEQQPLSAAVKARPAMIWAAVAVTLIVAVVGGYLWQPKRFKTAASRILLPFVSIDPVYRTRLFVTPGDVEAVGSVTIQIRIEDERPAELAVLLERPGRVTTEIVPVAPGANVVEYTISDIDRSLSYAVRGGDFVSPYYRIEVPTPARVARVQATFQYPEYTRLPERTHESSGDLEAVRGTKADVAFVLDHPADAATLVLQESAGNEQRTESRIKLVQHSPTEFRTNLVFNNSAEYRLETEQKNRPPHPTAWHSLRSLSDEAPKLELTGLPPTGEAPLDTPLSLGVSASDDFGLTQCGLYHRRPLEKGTAKPADDGWKPLLVFKPDGETRLAQPAELLAISLGAVEGDRLELAVRATDACPGRDGQWTTGQIYGVIVAGDGAQLQLQYEQILRTEAELSNLIATQQQLHDKSDVLVRKLDADPTADGNIPAKVKELLDWTNAQANEQRGMREATAKSAKQMVASAGSLRLSLGMLADTEMVRSLRVFDSIATRDDAAGRKTAFTEVRATQKRTLQSLQQILDHYVRFRQDWETAHMTPFVRMLADRQRVLKESSQRRAETRGEIPELLREAGARRQKKLSELCSLAGTAFSGMAERTQSLESELAGVFAGTAEALESDGLKQPMEQASKAVSTGDWSAAVVAQSTAADLLEQIHARLRAAQADAARRVLAAVEDKAATDLEAQAELEKLKEGSGEDLLDEPEGLNLENIMHLAEVAQKAKGKEGEPQVNNYLFPDSSVPGLQQEDTGKRQQFEILKLASTPGTTPSFPNQSDRQGNRVKPHIQEKFEDLVGALLEEEDEMKANYETYNLNAGVNINEPGEIGKQAGDLNSTAASAATGNQKPPTTNVGGASRVGRQGARAHGAAVGNESINRRGRDKVQEGQERSPDQAGSVKETKSDDPQNDTSTGIGGRKVESDEAKFSQNDAGEWTDDMADRMEKGKETSFSVDRQGKRFDPALAEKMRDMTSKQEQTLERLKSIRKDLKNLYLPTEHLDQLIDQLQSNLHSLNDRPTAEVFRLQQQTLEQLRGALQVFHQAHSGFQASLPREQVVRGRVLDDPSRPPPPGYEDAVSNYYRRLSAP